MKRFLTLIAITFAMLAVANAQYKVGDFYENSGLKGIVVKADASGEHGLIMSLDRFKGEWCTDKKARFETNAFYEDDGQKNMDAIESYIKQNGKSWSLFPYYEWCRNKGEGWYAPALDELTSIVTALNGSVGTYQDANVKKIESTITTNGGESLFGSVEWPTGGKVPYAMLSSTEGSKGKIFIAIFVQTSPFGLPKVMVEECKKSWSRNVGSRAVHKF